MSDILEQYPDAIDAVDQNGARALRYAAERGRVEICRLLLEQNIDVNAADTKKSSPVDGANYWALKNDVAKSTWGPCLSLKEP